MSHVAEGMKVDQKPSWSVFVEKRRFLGVNMLLMIVVCLVCLQAMVYSRPRDVMSPDKKFSIRADVDGLFIVKLPELARVAHLKDYEAETMSVRWRSDGKFFRISFREGRLGQSAIFRRNEDGAAEAFSEVNFDTLNLEKYLTDEPKDIEWGIGSVDIHKEFITVLMVALSPPGGPHPYASDYHNYEFFLKPKGHEFDIIRIERFEGSNKREVVWRAK